MNCQKFRELRMWDAAGGVTADAAAQVHLQNCAACQNLSRAEQAVAHLLGGLPRRDAPADFNRRLRQRMDAKPVSPAGWSFKRLFPAPVLVPVLGATVLAVGFSLNALFGGASSRVSNPDTSITDNVPQSVAANQPPKTGNSVITSKSEAPESTEYSFPQSVQSKHNFPSQPVVSKRAARFIPARHNTTLSSETSDIAFNTANGADGVRTIESGLNSPQVVSRNSSSEVLMQLPLTQREPLRFAIRGRDRSVRYLEVAPVTFGAQSFYQRDAVNPLPVTIAENDTIW